MSIAGSHDNYFIDGDSQTLGVSSSGSTLITTAVAFGTQTRLIRMLALGLVTSTSGIRVKITTALDSSVSSTLSALIPLNFPIYAKVNPGQVLTAVGNDAATTYSLVITPLTD